MRLRTSHYFFHNKRHHNYCISLPKRTLKIRKRIFQTSLHASVESLTLMRVSMVNFRGKVYVFRRSIKHALAFTFGIGGFAKFGSLNRFFNKRFARAGSRNIDCIYHSAGVGSRNKDCIYHSARVGSRNIDCIYHSARVCHC